MNILLKGNFYHHVKFYEQRENIPFRKVIFIPLFNHVNFYEQRVNIPLKGNILSHLFLYLI